MNGKNRIAKLLDEARDLARVKRRHVNTQRLKDSSWEEILTAVDAAILDESRATLDLIFAQIEEIASRPPQEIGGRKEPQDVHGFQWWLNSLADGLGTLPDVIPDVVMRAWAGRYEAEKRWAAKWNGCPMGVPHLPTTPVPLLRCDDCHMILPNCKPDDGTDDGWRGTWDTCPVCDGTTIIYADLTGRLKDPFERPAKQGKVGRTT